MSNNKSRLLDRRTGRQNIGVPPSPFQNRLESREEDQKFIRLITGAKSDDEVIKQFLFILAHFRTNSDLLMRLSTKLSVQRDVLFKKLSFYSSRYTDHLELDELFGRKRW